MAERLEDWTEKDWIHEQKYPWDTWFDGGVWMLTKPADFKITLEAMRIQAYKQAEKRGLSVQTMTTKGGKTLIMQARKKKRVKK